MTPNIFNLTRNQQHAKLPKIHHPHHKNHHPLSHPNLLDHLHGQQPRSRHPAPLSTTFRNSNQSFHGDDFLLFIWHVFRNARLLKKPANPHFHWLQRQTKNQKIRKRNH